MTDLQNMAVARWLRAALLGLVLVSLVGLAAAQPDPNAIGTVKTVTGQAFIDVGGRRVPAVVGMPVYLGTTLMTVQAGTLGVTFRDETVMSIGPDTQLTLDQYVFAPREGRLGLGASLLRGTLNYVSGQIAKLRPDAVNVNTPTGMIGVRGTQFVVRVDPP